MEIKVYANELLKRELYQPYRINFLTLASLTLDPLCDSYSEERDRLKWDVVGNSI